MSEAIKQCRYGCGKEIIYRGKTERAGSTGFFEIGTEIEHTYDRCARVRAEQDVLQTRLD